MSESNVAITPGACVVPLIATPWVNCTQLGTRGTSLDECYFLNTTVERNCGSVYLRTSTATITLSTGTSVCQYGTELYAYCTPYASGGASISVDSTTSTENGITPRPTLISTSNPTSASTFNTALNSTTPAPLHQKSSKDKVSSGAAAGIGIGCAIIGAILAGVAVLFLLRRKQRESSEHQQQLAKIPSRYPAIEKGLITTSTSAEKNGVARQIDSLLPQPAEDAAIAGGVSRIRDSIKNHVQNYYHRSIAVVPEMVDETTLSGLAAATLRSSSDIRDMLLNPATRMATIRSLLAYFVLSSCLGQPNAANSVLPKEISAFTSLQAKDGETDTGKYLEAL
jgi:hypothetical protein